jgi:triacylglycerol lipase
MFGSLAPARRRLILALLGLVVVVVGVALVVVVTRPSTKPVSQQDPGPVLLVPGYGGSQTGLDVLATYLRGQGKDVTVVSLPDGGQGDLNVQAQALATSVGAVLKRTGAKSVDVVGYSAGGVVARLWVRNHGGGSQARRVITLGSPQHGTDVAGLAGSLLPGACPVACQQLEPSSSLLAGLNAGDETPSGPTFVSVWTTHDDVVIPPDSASLQGALDFTVQSVCAGDQVQHSGLPTDPVVEAIVSAELAAGPPVSEISCLSS